MVESKNMKKLNELASKLKVSNSAVNAWCRAGKFKTAGKIRDNHIDTWFIDDLEFDEFVTNYVDGRSQNGVKRLK